MCTIVHSFRVPASIPTARKMIHSMMKIAAILLILATLHDSLQSAAAPIEQNTTNKVEKGRYLYLKFFRMRLRGSTKQDFTRDDDCLNLLINSIVENVKPEQNLVLSVYNIFYTILLLNLGATGESRNELNACIYLPDDWEDLFVYIVELSTQFDEIQKSDKVEVILSNSMFLPQGTQLKNDKYVRIAKKYFENDVQEVNFTRGGSEATDAFNNWVSKNTENRITQALKTQLPATTQLIATSVAFFNATWKQPFNKQNTKNEIFNTGVRQIQVPTMNQIGNVLYSYNVDKKFEVIGIPFIDEKYTMFVFLPFENSTYATFRPTEYEREAKNMITENVTRYVDYKLPRFQVGGLYSYKDDAVKAGVKKIFEKVELGNMVENADHLNVSGINYVAGLQVNEDGTCTADSSVTGRLAEAAEEPSAPHPGIEPVKFHANRPFAFSIFCTGEFTNAGIFDGVVSNPLSDA